MNEKAIQAMEAIFLLTEAVTDGGLTINDIYEALNKSIESGEEQVALVLAMTNIAIGMLENERELASKRAKTTD